MTITIKVQSLHINCIFFLNKSKQKASILLIFNHVILYFDYKHDIKVFQQSNDKASKNGNM